MNLMFDSFWRAVAYCMHPRVIGLSFLPLVLMVALSFGLAILASVLAGLLPAWQAARVTPAQQLKTQ